MRFGIAGGRVELPAFGFHTTGYRALVLTHLLLEGFWVSHREVLPSMFSPFQTRLAMRPTLCR